MVDLDLPDRRIGQSVRLGVRVDLRSDAGPDEADKVGVGHGASLVLILEEGQNLGAGQHRMVRLSDEGQDAPPLGYHRR